MTTPVSLATLREASGLYGDHPDAVQAIRDRLEVVLSQSSPSLSMLTDAGRDGMPYAVLALHALSDVEGAVDLLGYHWFDARVLTDERVRGWAQQASPAELRPLAGVRYPHDADNLPEAVLRAFDGLGIWAGVRLGAYLRTPPARYQEARWDDPAQVTTRIQALRHEEQGAGEHTLVERWYLASDIERTALGLSPVERGTLLVEYRKKYVDGLAGPVSRSDTAILYRDEGGPVTWTVATKHYDFDDQRKLVVARRQYAVKWLQGMIAAGVSSLGEGQGLLRQFAAPTEDFVNTGDGLTLLATIEAAATLIPQLVPALPVIRARLSPWLPEPDLVQL